ncbi:MAG TPA: flavodoxin domain-containing protein, partial [Dehalococcoidia bacterium]|nr:flavodoxin domain-containing protein [Dehalococcoidia bacterium]
MKALVVYDSTYGNTERVARAIGDAILGDVELRRAGQVDARDLVDIEMLIVGSPTQGGRPTPAMKQFLDSIPARGLQGVEVAAFDTRISAADKFFVLKLFLNAVGYAADRIAAGLKAKGGHLLSEPQGFIVEGKEGPLRQSETQRAARWGCQLGKARKPAAAG